jgi:hypothetical protein
MRSSGFVVERALALHIVGALLASPASAAAQPADKARCATAYEEGQRLQRRNALLLARERLLVCARDPCPAVLQPDCARWLETLEQALPSIVIVARAPDGSERRAFHLLIDGTFVADRIEGRAIEIDPGEHTVRLEFESGEAATQRIFVNEAEKERVVTLEIRDDAHTPFSPSRSPASAGAAAPEKTPVTSSGGIPWPTYALGGVGLLGLAAFGYFGVSGIMDRNGLASCRPYCDSSAVDAVHSKFIAADVCLGISAVALVAGAYFFIARPSSSTPGTRPGRALHLDARGISVWF